MKILAAFILILAVCLLVGTLWFTIGFMNMLLVLGGTCAGCIVAVAIAWSIHTLID